VLRLTNLRVTFNPGTAMAVDGLRGVDLTVESGEFVTVIGTNGAGKSTLLSAIAGDVVLTHGSIVVDDEDLTRLPARQRSAIIGRVFQDPRAGTCASLTVEENLELAGSRGRRRGFGRACGDAARRRFLRDQLERLGLGLEGRLTSPIGTLSGGQRQAICLLMATMLPMKLLLLDEHTAALDPVAAHRVLQLSAQICETQRLTTLMVTHSMRDSLLYGDRTIMMTGGRIAFDIAGDERRRHDVKSMMDLFAMTTGRPVEDDQLVLSSLSPAPQSLRKIGRQDKIA
jgi:putative tryptophan/tyrosine transport system ATP-binding protein